MIVLIYATANTFMLRHMIYKQEGNRNGGSLPETWCSVVQTPFFTISCCMDLILDSSFGGH